MPPLPCETLGKLLRIPESQFSHLENGCNGSVFLGDTILPSPSLSEIKSTNKLNRLLLPWESQIAGPGSEGRVAGLWTLPAQALGAFGVAKITQGWSPARLYL